MDITWLTAFIDQPAETFEAGSRFWEQATESTRSATRGPNGEYATLIPSAGESCLRVQRLEGSPRIHLDFHIDDLDAAREHAEQLGATTVYRDRHAIMRSPTGFTFCFVTHGGRAELPSAVTEPRPHLLTQVSIDIPHAQFEEECEFWAAMTGWDLLPTSAPSFAALQQPDHIPLRLLLQRRGTDDAGTTTRAHLDIACGSHFVEVSETFLGFGAELVAHHTHWTTMRDPAGLEFCLTRRDPETGKIAPPL